MSSMTHRHSSRASGTKKKFGKNLNKVTKAPAPPIAGSARGAASSSRNGLLLLSTKRSSSTGTATASGGLLSSKATTTTTTTTTGTTANVSPTKARQPFTEAYTSAHDALLGAVIGASRMTDTQQTPDAWGVAEKQTTLEPAPSKGNGDDSSTMLPSSSNTIPTETERPSLVEEPTADSRPTEPSSTNRESDDPTAAMTPVNHQAREQRRADEEKRFLEQKERAAERLRELERKISTEKSQAPQPLPVPLTIAPRPTDDDTAPVADAFPSPNPPNDMNVVDRPVSAVAALPYQERTRTPRTLFDPNRPSTSFGTTKSDEGNNKNEGNKVSPTTDQEYSRDSVGVPRASRNGSGDVEEDATPLQQQPVIHISSYETRDRGERNNNAGPRMLFDPKSGSMVTAPSRDDAAGRGKKGKPKGRRDRAGARESTEGDDNSPGNGKSKRNKGRKDEKRDRKRAEDADIVSKESSMKRGLRAHPAQDRLPRTCGVLYKRDESGNLVCADGCDGDQGFGAHSIPGGRVRNPVDHAKFVEQQKVRDQDQGANGLAYGLAGYEDARAYYGSKDSTFKSPTQEPEMVQEEVWVKPDEKIELVTGEDDSPTLQATASTWVPSQAALAAAATAKEDIVSPPNGKMISDEEGSDEEEHPSFVGLGFDPTENMDSVMQSPSVRASKNRDLDPVQLAALALDAPNGTEPTSKSIFAFGSSSTWGTGGAGTDWAAPNSKGVVSKGQDAAAGAASFLSLSTGNPWGASGLSGFGGAGAAMPGNGSNGQGPTGD